MSGKSWDRAVFDRLFGAHPDPWGFDSSPYEADKYARTLSALDGRRFRRGLELGCANGAMTEKLAGRCDALVAADISTAALALARQRCAALPHVRLVLAGMPDGFDALPGGAFDLVVISELLYFLCADDIDRLAARVAGVLAPDARLLLVNWTGPTDTPCTGDEAAERFLGALAAGCDGIAVRRERRDTYRLDRADRGRPGGKGGALPA